MSSNKRDDAALNIANANFRGSMPSSLLGGLNQRLVSLKFGTKNDEQFECAGVAVIRHTIQKRGLLLPAYTNTPKLVYVEQGRGIQGAVFPGCPETFQSSGQYSRDGSQSSEDQHQKVQQVREGDVVALPSGVADWFYNNGDSPLVLVQLLDTSNPANQLDQDFRNFFLAGNPQRELQSQRRLIPERPVVSPHQSREEEEREIEHRRGRGGRFNGIEETFCTARLKHNINDPERADFLIHALDASPLSTASISLSFDLSSLVLREVYSTRGNGRIQIVGDNGQTIFDGEVREGQVVTAPQSFAVVKKAGSQGFEWVSFKPTTMHKEDARRLKNYRVEVSVFSPSQSGRSDEIA
ncbi:hypothetical protein POTOM_057885 [Populus tomentosa]|uniref:Cupin type-1 domain-containing protein n=1 Tax=Populus tomentosa TaxID=118781 RepID=A0A8X8BWP6_POPTO|nr:hypothetical protein POTOM_057885 [Populus tomentosa]